MHTKLLQCVGWGAVGFVFIFIVLSCNPDPTSNKGNSPTPNPIFMTLRQQAQQALQNADYAQAKILYEKLLQEKPRDPSFIYNLAVISDEMNENQRAGELYQQVLTIDPKNALALGGLGWLEFKKKNFERCIELSTQALEINPSLILAKFNIGLSYIALNDLDRAMEQYLEGTANDTQQQYTMVVIQDLKNYLDATPVESANIAYYALAYFYKLAGLRELEKKSLQAFLETVPEHSYRGKALALLAAIKD